MGSTARSPRVRARVTPHRGQGESLVPLYTRESVSLSLYMKDKPVDPRLFNPEACAAVPCRRRFAVLHAYIVYVGCVLRAPLEAVELGREQGFGFIHNERRRMDGICAELAADWEGSLATLQTCFATMARRKRSTSPRGALWPPWHGSPCTTTCCQTFAGGASLQVTRST